MKVRGRQIGPSYRHDDAWEPYDWICDVCGAYTYKDICTKCEAEPSQGEVDLERRKLDVAERVRALR